MTPPGKLELNRGVAGGVLELLDEFGVPRALGLARFPQRPGVGVDGQVKLAGLRRVGGG